MNPHIPKIYYYKILLYYIMSKTKKRTRKKRTRKKRAGNLAPLTKKRLIEAANARFNQTRTTSEGLTRSMRMKFRPWERHTAKSIIKIEGIMLSLIEEININRTAINRYMERLEQ
jgi:hypothetical protein